MTDSFAGSMAQLNFPGVQCAAITPSDTVDLPATTRWIYVGTAGNLALELLNDAPGTATVFNAVPVGLYLLRVRRVHATNTTASNLVGIW